MVRRREGILATLKHLGEGFEGHERELDAGRTEAEDKE